MASKGKGKGKDKLRKEQFKVGTKIINLKRFAYDMLALSMRKFGVAEDCIAVCNTQENDYGYPDFIVVLSRFLLRCQITQRNFFFTVFKCYSERNEFESLDKIKSALPLIFYHKTQMGEKLMDLEAITTLAVISEFILFQYKNNRKLYLNELAKFWCDYWSSMKKEIEKCGGLTDLYTKFSVPDEARVDVFFNVFIPVHCIPYNESPTLEDLFRKEYRHFFAMPEEEPDKDGKQFKEEVARANMIVSRISIQDILGEESSEDEASAIYPLTNTGLGILQHEVLLQLAMETDTATLPQELPSTSRQRTSTERRGPSKVKERQRKKTSSHSNVKDLERLNIGGLGDDVTTSPWSLPTTSRQETGRNRTESSNEKKKSSPRLSKEALERLNTGLSGADAAASSPESS